MGETMAVLTAASVLRNPAPAQPRDPRRPLRPARHGAGAWALAIALFVCGSARGGADVLQLPLGDPARRDRQVNVTAGQITDARTGGRLDADGLARRLGAVQLLFIGEDHTSTGSHAAQLAIVQALHRAGRDVVIALEMYPWSAQGTLDRWVAGGFPDEQSFLEASGWYESWGYRWEYYQDIFRFARDRRLPLVAVNAPRTLVTRVRLEGLPALDEARREDPSHLPPRVDLDSSEYRQLFTAYMGSTGTHGDARFEGLYRAQCTWDAIMGWNARNALARQPGADTIVVVLLGSGHVTYGLGAPRQLAGELPATSLATVVPVTAGPAGRVVQASYADYLWGLPPEGAPAYPELGITLAGATAAEPTRIIQLTRGSPAYRAGLQVGDRVERVGSQPVRSVGDLRRALAGSRWGDTLTVHVRRDSAPPVGPPLQIAVPLQRPSDTGT